MPRNVSYNVNLIHFPFFPFHSMRWITSGSHSIVTVKLVLSTGKPRVSTLGICSEILDNNCSLTTDLVNVFWSLIPFSVYTTNRNLFTKSGRFFILMRCNKLKAHSSIVFYMNGNSIENLINR